MSEMAYIVVAKVCFFVSAGVLQQAPVVSLPPAEMAFFSTSAGSGCYCDLAKTTAAMNGIKLVRKDLATVIVSISDGGILTFTVSSEAADKTIRDYLFPIVVVVGDQEEACKPAEKVS
jgi:hypothetical protein